MATVGIVGACSGNPGAGASATYSTNVAALPAGISTGDLGLLIVTMAGTPPTINAPTGWTQLASSPQVNSTNFRSAAFIRTMASSDSGTTVSGTLSSSARWAVAGIVLTGAVTTLDNVTFNIDTTNNTPIVYPAITPVANDCLQVALVSTQTSTGGTTGNTAGTGYTEQVDTATSSGATANVAAEVCTKQLSGQAGSSQGSISSGASASIGRDIVFMVTVAPVHLLDAAGVGTGTGAADAGRTAMLDAPGVLTGTGAATAARTAMVDAAGSAAGVGAATAVRTATLDAAGAAAGVGAADITRTVFLAAAGTLTAAGVATSTGGRRRLIEVRADSTSNWASAAIAAGLGSTIHDIRNNEIIANTDTGAFALGVAGAAEAQLPHTVMDDAEIINVSKQVGLTDSTKLQNAINKAASRSGYKILLPDGLSLASSGVTMPQGIYMEGQGGQRTILTYSGTSGFAVTVLGTSQTDSRIGGALRDLAISVTAAGGSGLLLQDCRDIDVDVKILGGGGTTTRKAVYGIRLIDLVASLGTSWNRLRFYIEYVNGDGLSLDASSVSPNFVTRSLFHGHVQSCNTGIHLTDASTHEFHVHPQNCTNGWVLDGTVGSDTNEIYTVTETCTVPWAANAASQNNTVRGSLQGAIPASPGTATNFLTQFNTTLAPFTQMQYGGFGSAFNVQPPSGSTDNWQLYSRDNSNALKRGLYLEVGNALNRLVVDQAQLVVNSVAALPTAAAFYLNAIASVGYVAGVSDGAFYGCIRQSGGSYAWVPFGVSSGLTPTLYAEKTALTTINNVATQTADPDLTLNLAASTVYEFTAFLFYEGTTTADMTLGWSVPSGATITWSADGLRQAAAAGSDSLNRLATTAAAGPLIVGGAGTGTKVFARPSGVISVSTAGAFTLQWAQGTAEVSDLTIHARSMLKASKIA